jgi:serine/threonine protein kinase
MLIALLGNVTQVVPALRNDPLAADLLSSMLTYDPQRRVSACAALLHPWFADVSLPGQGWDPSQAAAASISAAAVVPPDASATAAAAAFNP